MFAVIKTGGKQYRVEKENYLKVEKLNLKVGEVFSIKEILIIGNDDKTKIGKPYLDKTEVICEVVDQKKDRKVIAYKYKPKKGYHKKIGHRKKVTILKIKEIKSEE